MMHFAPGLGLIGGLVVDQHFGARNRIGRLMTAVAHNPDLLGIGLDEDTAVEITSDGHLSVLGRGAVMVVDGADVSYTDIYRANEGAPLSIFGLHVHTLTNGFQLNLATRAPSPPSASSSLAETGLMFGEGI
jgi:cyanophycinase